MRCLVRNYSWLMRNPIIVALDVPTADAALKLVEQLAPVSGGFKVGSELFTSAGPDIVRRIRGLGAPVFLDLKFHDIPNTVAKAVAAAVQLDVQMLTVHASGGPEMLKAAEQVAQESAWKLGHAPPLVLGRDRLDQPGRRRAQPDRPRSQRQPPGAAPGQHGQPGGAARPGLLAAGGGGTAADAARQHATGHTRHPFPNRSRR